MKGGEGKNNGGLTVNKRVARADSGHDVDN